MFGIFYRCDDYSDNLMAVRKTLEGAKARAAHFATSEVERLNSGVVGESVQYNDDGTTTTIPIIEAKPDARWEWMKDRDAIIIQSDEMTHGYMVIYPIDDHD